MIKKFIVNNRKYFFDSEEVCIIDSEEYDKNLTDKISLFEVVERCSEKITILLTTKCNASCVYCYEKENYWIDIPTVINRKESIKICKNLVEKYDEIKTVSFFGGEPLINFKELKYITCTLNKFIKVNRFEIITNGMLFNDEIISFLKKFNFKINISLDGPEEIHNKLRLGTNYSKILKNINKLKSLKMDNQIYLNCTFTKYHECVSSKEEIDTYFKDLGFYYTINYENELEKYNSTLHNKYEEIDDTLERLYRNNCENISIYVKSFFDALIHRKYFSCFCPELLNNVTETFLTNGTNVPCLSLMKFKDDEDLIKKINFKELEPCKSCWAKKICKQCIVYLVKNEQYKNFKIEDCLNEKILSYLVKKYIYLFEDDIEKLQKIIDNYCDI